MGFDASEFEYSDIKVSIFGRELTGLRGLTYKTSREKELVYGAGANPKAIQRGQKKNEGSLMVLKSDYDDMLRAANAAGYNSLCDVPGKLINITCVYQNEDKSRLQTSSLFNCEFTEEEDGMKAGDKFKEVTLPFLYLSQKTI
ncbi:MAG TPA: hypothetical protein VK173_04410 [Lacibacter sp.]|nr:hypothetical protein [Lacibacter sp.]